MITRDSTHFMGQGPLEAYRAEKALAETSRGAWAGLEQARAMASDTPSAPMCGRVNDFLATTWSGLCGRGKRRRREANKQRLLPRVGYQRASGRFVSGIRYCSSKFWLFLKVPGVLLGV